MARARMSVEVIDADDALEPVLDAWRSLAVAGGNAFVTPEWYLAALQVLDGDAKPAVAVARGQSGEVQALLPLVRRRSTSGPVASFAAARFGDLFDLVSADAEREEIATALAPALARHLGTRCELDLGRVDARTRWWEELASAWPTRMASVAQPEEVLPNIAIEGLSWDEYLATRSGHFRKQVRREMRRLKRDHDVRVRRSSSADEVRRDLGTLFDLHDARWAERCGTSSMADSGVRDFHAEFATAAHGRGWLRLYLLEVDGAAVAAWYGWRLGDRFSFYQGGFDPAWSRYSVGFLLIAETVREAVEEGAAEYDLLLGDEQFKSRLATGQRVGRRVLLAPPASGARLAATLKRAARSGLRAMPEPARGRIRALRGRIRG